MDRTVAIVDYGMGNLRSIYNACRAVGGKPVIAHDAGPLRDAHAIILPGVGAFGQGMEHLMAGGWCEVLEQQVLSKAKPFLGICLGMQLLADSGSEHGMHRGLGWVSGTIKKVSVAQTGLRLPHIGWNEVEFKSTAGLYEGLGASAAFYFVHSYGFFPENNDLVTGVCEYGEEIAASLAYENIVATQYHPEKSHRDGLAVLRNFLSVT